MNPRDYRYTKDHEWIHVDANGEAKVGIADYAQAHLGDLVYFDLPAPNAKVDQFNKLGEVESVKAVSDIFSPASGEVIEVNQAAIDSPKIVNKDPYGMGWLFKIKLSNQAELNNLMDADKYDKFVEEQEKEHS